MQVEKESKSVGLEKKDAINWARWRVGVREIAAGVNPATPVYGDKPGSKLDWLIWSFSKSKKVIVTNCLVFFVNILVIFMVHVHIKIIILVVINYTDNNMSTLSFKK